MFVCMCVYIYIYIYIYIHASFSHALLPPGEILKSGARTGFRVA